MESYEKILGRMKENYKNLTGIEPAEQSDIGVRLSVLAGEIYALEMNIEWLLRQTNINSAQGEYLDYHGAMRGIGRFDESKAEGEVIISVVQEAQTDIVIPKGFVVAAADEGELLCFETTEDVTVVKGGLSIHAPVRAMEAGRKYNVMAKAVDTVVTSVSQISGVTNPDPMEGGRDKEDDESLRARIKDSLKNIPCAANCAYYRDCALSVDGVYDASVVPKGRGAGTVDVYIAAEGAEVTDDTLARVQEILSYEREVNVDVAVYKAQSHSVDYYLQIEVKDGYDFKKVSKACVRALSDFVARCGVGAKISLTKAGEQIIHIEGVEDYSFENFTNRNVNLLPSQFGVVGSVTVVEGV